MLVVIEGPDKTGKTTLAKAISKELGYEYVHFSAPRGSPADEYIDFLLNLRRPTVCDRFHLGELVYGPMLRGKAGITPLELATIERVMRLKRTIVVHAVTSIRLANERLVHSDEHEVVDQAQNAMAAKAFEAVIANTNAGPVLRHDGLSMANLNTTVSDIYNIASTYLPVLKVYTGIGTVLGPKLVFVGEQVNNNVTWRGLPFDRGMASQFLLDVFKAADVLEGRVYVCNADKLTTDEVDALGRGMETQFIALGTKAAAKLNKFGVSCLKLHHPQFVKRFRYRQRNKYISQLKELAICA